MKHAIYDFTKLTTSLFVFVAMCLAGAGVTYEFFSPDGALFMWIKGIGSENPLLLLVLGATLVMAKRWIEAYDRSAKIADVLVYLAVLVGVYFGCILVLAVV